ncbi:MAG: hypothetical protein ABEJ26_14740 [Halosimplex sp.]
MSDAQRRRDDRDDRGERYRATRYGGHETEWLLVQDVENDHAWIQTDAAVTVSR